MFEIQKGLPIPPKSQGRYPCKYPLSQMEVGDSFFVPEPGHPNTKGRAETLGFKFTTRVVTENGVKGTRVWRIA